MLMLGISEDTVYVCQVFLIMAGPYSLYCLILAQNLNIGNVLLLQNLAVVRYFFKD